MAELWLGAHEEDSSCLPDGSLLSEVILEQPVRLLGEKASAMFGARLPFLMKVLAAAEPLSLQVHPTSERARLGFTDEETRGIPRSAPHRRYRDPSHKPELIFALTRFEGMAGFREVGRTAEILRLLDLRWADDLADRMDHQETAFQCLREIVTELLALPVGEVRARLTVLVEAARRAERAAHREDPRMRPPTLDRSSVERESRRLFALVPSLCERYPADPGVLVTLLLNHVVVAAGDAMFVQAGVIHAYTSGLGIEIMASSDNVVRAGLTPKFVDIEELLRITNFTPMPPPLWASTRVGDDDLEFRPPVTEFALRIVRTPAAHLPCDGPRIILVVDGAVTVRSGGGAERLARGESVFVEAADGPVTSSGSGRLAVASLPV